MRGLTIVPTPGLNNYKVGGGGEMQEEGTR